MHLWLAPRDVCALAATAAARRALRKSGGAAGPDAVRKLRRLYRKHFRSCVEAQDGLDEHRLVRAPRAVFLLLKSLGFCTFTDSQGRKRTLRDDNGVPVCVFGFGQKSVVSGAQRALDDFKKTEEQKESALDSQIRELTGLLEQTQKNANDRITRLKEELKRRKEMQDTMRLNRQKKEKDLLHGLSLAKTTHLQGLEEKRKNAQTAEKALAEQNQICTMKAELAAIEPEIGKLQRLGRRVDLHELQMRKGFLEKQTEGKTCNRPLTGVRGYFQKKYSAWELERAGQKHAEALRERVDFSKSQTAEKVEKQKAVRAEQRKKQLEQNKIQKEQKKQQATAGVIPQSTPPSPKPSPPKPSRFPFLSRFRSA